MKDSEVREKNSKEIPMEKRYESDMTPKEKRQLEWKKLKGMSFKAKLGYLWEYYKFVLVILVIVAALISMGVQMYHNAQQIEVLSLAVVDANFGQEDGQDLLERDLLEYMGTGDKHEIIAMDTSALSDEDYTSVMKMTVLMGTAAVDIMICNEAMYDKYNAQEAFVSWKEVLGDRYSEFSEYMTEDGKLDLSKCKNWEKYNLTYQPSYAVVMASSPKLENCIKFAEFMTK